MVAQTLAVPTLRVPDVLVSVSPSFPALLPGIIHARSRRIPWVLWLHDLLPDGASATGLIEDGVVLRMSQRLEVAAYRQAKRIVVSSASFTPNLLEKGVPESKIQHIPLPATRTPSSIPSARAHERPLRLLSMGNIGHSQGLEPLVRALDASNLMQEGSVELSITGDGVAADQVRVAFSSHQIRMLGVVDDHRLEEELLQADVGIVSQLYAGPEFNIPSKMMNFMSYGLPVLAAVNPLGEVARIVRESGAGWVVSSSDPEAFVTKIAEICAAPFDVTRCAEAALAYAQEHFTQRRATARFTTLLCDVASGAHLRGQT